MVRSAPQRGMSPAEPARPLFDLAIHLDGDGHFSLADALDCGRALLFRGHFLILSFDTIPTSPNPANGHADCEPLSLVERAWGTRSTERRRGHSSL